MNPKSKLRIYRIIYFLGIFIFALCAYLSEYLECAKTDTCIIVSFSGFLIMGIVFPNMSIQSLVCKGKEVKKSDVFCARMGGWIYIIGAILSMYFFGRN